MYSESRDKIKNYYLENRDRIINNQNLYDEQNRDKINTRLNENFKNGSSTVVNFRSICRKRIRIHQALRGKNKSSSTLDILGTDINLYRKWIEFQFTPEMNW